MSGLGLLALWLALCVGHVVCMPLLGISQADAMERGFFQGVALLAVYILGRIAK